MKHYCIFYHKCKIFLPIIFCMLFLAPTTVAAEVGRITVEGNLNVRQKPTTESPVIYQLCNGEEVEIIETIDDWVKIEIWNDYGYIKSKYIEKRKTPWWNRRFIKFTNIEEILLPWKGTYKLWMTSTLLIMALVVFFIGGRFADNDKFLITAILSTIFSLAIIVYVCYLGSNATWFLKPEKSGGWGWVILHGILFLFLVLAHFIGVWGVFKSLKDDFYDYQCKHGRKEVNLTLGLVTLVLIFLAIIVCTFFNNDYLWWIIGVFTILQIIQSIMVYSSCGFWGTFLYVITISATFLLLIPTAIVGAIATIVILVLAIINAAPAASAVIPTSSSSSSGSPSSDTDSFDYGHIGDSFAGPCIRADNGNTAQIFEDEGGGYVRTDKGRFYVDSYGNAKKV